MEENLVHNESLEEEEEEYVLLNLDEVRGQVDIPPNAPYVLSGLDTPNPILVIGDSLKLIGEYEETIGTCLVFSEGRKFIIDPNQAPAKEVKPIASLQKIWKFRLLYEGDVQDATLVSIL
ncbi:hypothetical protein PVL29_025416 [Vitis rotundifolia]|uniref:Transcription factor TFIIIC triple barrel domain-containing protein n=1 Tax=Vitis rotundifolia TaxID=103349 RepID=A0AA38YJQ7_VITRO|nr:hypothetical protein PVL29_025416 [Vitis rotundifolia]